MALRNRKSADPQAGNHPENKELPRDRIAGKAMTSGESEGEGKCNEYAENIDVH